MVRMIWMITAFVGRVLPYPAFAVWLNCLRAGYDKLPLPCASTAFVTKTLPFIVFRTPGRTRVCVCGQRYIQCSEPHLNVACCSINVLAVKTSKRQQICRVP